MSYSLSTKTSFGESQPRGATKSTVQRETVDKYLYMNHDKVLEAKSPWHLYISINWSVTFIVTMLLLSHFSGHIIHLFSTSSFLSFLNFYSPYSKKKKKKISYSPYLSTFIITLPPTFSLCLCFFIFPLLSTLPLQFLYHFPFLIFWLFFFLFYFV